MASLVELSQKNIRCITLWRQKVRWDICHPAHVTSCLVCVFFKYFFVNMFSSACGKQSIMWTHSQVGNAEILELCWLFFFGIGSFYEVFQRKLRSSDIIFYDVIIPKVAPNVELLCYVKCTDLFPDHLKVKMKINPLLIPKASKLKSERSSPGKQLRDQDTMLPQEAPVCHRLKHRCSENQQLSAVDCPCNPSAHSTHTTLKAPEYER